MKLKASRAKMRGPGDECLRVSPEVKYWTMRDMYEFWNN